MFFESQQSGLFVPPPSILWWKVFAFFSNKVAKLVEFTIEKKEYFQKILF